MPSGQVAQAEAAREPGVLALPAGQEAQANEEPAAEVEDHVLAGQRVQGDAPAEAHVPGPQGRQLSREVAPVVREENPSGQGVQVEEPGKDA